MQFRALLHHRTGDVLPSYTYGGFIDDELCRVSDIPPVHLRGRPIGSNVA